MTKLNELIAQYRSEGYPGLLASSTACQDVLLSKIAASSLNQNVTIKGGVLMHSMSNSKRRATRDFDLDFIRYSLSEESIDQFLAILDSVDDGISIKRVGAIEDLAQQDYNGKRVNILIGDGTRTITTKLDIGVQADLDIEQRDFYFDISGQEESVCLLANSKEQIFGEKLTSLLKWGIATTRFKDIHDFYYLGHQSDFSKELLETYLTKWVYNSSIAKLTMRNDSDIKDALSNILNDEIFRRNFATSRDKWLDINDDEAIDWLICFFS
jgi:hypothetical protein